MRNNVGKRSKHIVARVTIIMFIIQEYEMIVRKPSLLLSIIHLEIK